MKSKLCSFLALSVASFFILGSSVADAHYYHHRCHHCYHHYHHRHCRWVPAHWHHGVYVPGHTVCWRRW